MDKKTIILEQLKEKSPSSVQELSQICKVSLPTMRKLLTRMQQENLLQFHRGWARPNSKNRKDILDEFLVNHYAEKKAIGKWAAGLVGDNETVFIGGGSTVSFLVPFLAQKSGLTIITNSIFTIETALEFPQLNLICTGGGWSEGSLSFLGNMPELLKNIFPNKIFLSAVAADCTRGLSQPRPQEANDEYRLDIPGSEIYYLMDSSKLNKVCPWQISPARSLQHIVTDSRFPSEDIPRWKKNGITIHIAP